jgi:D-alanyl-D-alanine carboxypeptidase (penicillin-binding protein 5/6)
MIITSKDSRMTRKFLYYFSKTLCIACLFQTSFCTANPIMPLGSISVVLPLITPSAPNLEAKGFLLIDANSGKVLAEKNADQRLAPASLTKLMSLYVISSALKNGSIHPDDKVRISNKAWRTGGSRMFVKAGDEVAVKDLLQGIIVASGNDASVALAEYIAGSEEAIDYCGAFNMRMA